MSIDPYFRSGKHTADAAAEGERHRLHGLSKEERFQEYHRIQGLLYAGKEVSRGEELFYRDVRATYNSAYHLGVDANRLREEPA